MKIRKLELVEHPILGNLKLDFTTKDGKVIDCILLAGENGTGKSSLLNILFSFSNLSLDNQKRAEKRFFEIEISDMELETLKNNDKTKQYFQEPIQNNILKISIDYSISENWNQIKVIAQTNNEEIIKIPGHIFANNDVKKVLKAIFSDTEINFTPKQITSVTSKNIDSDNLQSIRSNQNLATEITQLLIDIQNIDALEFMEWAKKNSNKTIDKTKIDIRTKRFTNAFDYIFPHKKYDRIENTNNKKDVIFKEHEKEMSIENLSSGEKQIVFRGSFLLKDKKSSKGALILIDEPEISLNPTWQLKISTFFKKLFTDENGLTSQLFIATHSPFILHNVNRNEDKVIILEKDNRGKITTAIEPKYFSWSPEEKIKTAFKIDNILKPNLITVFVEGETDEIYFTKAIEIYKIDKSLIDFKWIGRIDKNGNAENTGDSALNKAKIFFQSNENMILGKIVLLYDSDTNKPEENLFDNFKIQKMTINNSNDIYKIGIENLLILPSDFQKNDFYSEKLKVDNYGAESTIRELNKTKLCTYITNNIDIKKQKAILSNLKIEIDKITNYFKK